MTNNIIDYRNEIKDLYFIPFRAHYIIPMNKRETYLHLKNHAKNIRFDLLCNSAEMFGFTCRGGRGSHRIFVREDVREMLNFQDVGGKAKPYQVKQLCKVIEDYSLLEGDDHV